MAENKIMSVVTLPLKTEKWQEDILQKRFELCRKIYNNMLHYEMKQLNKALQYAMYCIVFLCLCISIWLYLEI